MPEPALFSVSTEKTPDRCVIRPEGELDVAAVPEMELELDRSLSECPEVEIDMAEVSFIDSSGLRLLLSARQRCSEGGGSLRVTNPSEDTRRLLDLTGLSELLLGGE